MLSAKDLARLQQEQYRHDQRNHADILCLPKADRLKHYGLHFAKYLGRLARDSDEPKSLERTLVDAMLVCLSSANTLHLVLVHTPSESGHATQIDPLRTLADATGRFADACEKTDHLEEFLPIARSANIDLLNWILASAAERNLDLEAAIKLRRLELAQRQFYIPD
jgi:hypothetical protein